MSTIFDLIDFFKTKKAEGNVGSGDQILSFGQINGLIDEFKIHRTNFLKENFEELKHKIKQKPEKLRVPLFSLMEYDWNENSHSNILQYLLDHNSFKAGPAILAHLITDSSTDDKNELRNKILNGTYTIEREFAIPKGRIDLFILDDTERFVVIIENKLLAGIGKTESDDENEIDKTESDDENQITTQLEIYEKWCDEKYPNYERQYILLNFSIGELDNSMFEKVTYKQLYDNLTRDDIKQTGSNDNIFGEYLLLLDSLLNPKSHDLLKIKKLANNIIENDRVDISLTEYHDLKTIFYDKK